MNELVRVGIHLVAAGGEVVKIRVRTVNGGGSIVMLHENIF